MFALSSLRRFAVFATVLSIVGLIAFFSSQHRLRLVVTPFVRADAKSLDWELGSRSMLPMRFEHLPAKAVPFREVIASLAQFDEAHPTTGVSKLAATDDSDSCLKLIERSVGLHCYNVDLGVHVFLARMGVNSRMWDLNGSKGLGGFGHNLLEIRDLDRNRWEVIDPYYHCYFTLRRDSLPLSFVDFRALLLTNPDALTLRWYSRVAHERDEASIRKELRFLAPFSSVHRNNDYRWRYDHRFGLLMPFAPLFDQLPLRMSRALRTVMLGNDDARYILEDEHTPQYPILLSHALFWSLSAAGILSIVLLITTALRIRATKNGTAEHEQEWVGAMI